MPHNLFVPAGATATVPLSFSYPHADPGLPPPTNMKIETDNPAVANAKFSDDGRAVVIAGSGDGAAMISIGNGEITDTIHVTVARAVANAVSADTDAARYEMAPQRRGDSAAPQREPPRTAAPAQPVQQPAQQPPRRQVAPVHENGPEADALAEAV